MVQIDFPGLDCGLPIHIEMMDGAVIKIEPKEPVGYVAVPYSKWREQWAYS
jgi:hypothetical protein